MTEKYMIVVRVGGSFSNEEIEQWKQWFTELGLNYKGFYPYEDYTDFILASNDIPNEEVMNALNEVADGNVFVNEIENEPKKNQKKMIPPPPIVNRKMINPKPYPYSNEDEEDDEEDEEYEEYDEDIQKIEGEIEEIYAKADELSKTLKNLKRRLTNLKKKL